MASTTLGNERLKRDEKRPFGQKSLRHLSLESEEAESDRFAFVALLSQDGRRVLVTHNSEHTEDTALNKWRLPLFMYWSGLHENTSQLLNDLRVALSIERNRKLSFSVGPAFISYAASISNGIFGFSSLRVVYCYSEFDAKLLPENFCWADACLMAQVCEDLASVMNSTEDKNERDEMEFVHRTLEVAHELVGEGGAAKLSSLRDKRYHRDWYLEAMQWFRRSVENLTGVPLENPVQELKTGVTSTIWKVQSSKGWYYLKAPYIDSAELATTAAVAKLIPHSVIHVASMNEQLGCFVMRELDQPDSLEDDSGNLPKILQVLAKVQLSSKAYVDELIERGVPDRRPTKFIEQLEVWREDEKLLKVLYPRMHDRLTKCMPRLIRLCKRLEASPIPAMLVHGDFAPRNIGLRALSDTQQGQGKDGIQEMVLFDWQFGCVSHPFSDMFDLFMDYDGYSEIIEKKGLDEEDLLERRALLEGRKQYLAHFTAEFEVDDDTLREEFELGRVFGLCLRMWETYQCVECSKFQYMPRVHDFLRDVCQQMIGRANRNPLLNEN